MADPNRALFESVVHLLAPVLDELVFVGGCTTGLFITDPAAGGIRPTKDVDAIVDVTSYAPYTALTERLRALGLGEDTTPGAPLCRWRHGHLIVDVMPTDATVLGFSNRWYPTAVETARTLQISGHDVRVVTPALFIATKLEAFHAMTSSRAMTSRTSSRSSMAVLRLWVMSPPRRTTYVHTSAPRSGHCSTIGTSPRPCSKEWMWRGTIPDNAGPERRFAASIPPTRA